jgi:hypothetical protein
MIVRDATAYAGLVWRAARLFGGAVLLLTATAYAGISGAGTASAQTVPAGGAVVVPETATAQPATQPDAPYVTPAVDTDITYVLTPAQDGLAPAHQRMRWQAAGLKQRLDPEGGSVYMITTWKNRTLSVVDESRGRVSTMPMPGQQDLALPGQRPASGTYARVGQSIVAGEACQLWRTVDTEGHESDACYTADGILLQVVQQGRIMVRALTVSRAAQPDSVFEVPAGLVVQAPAHP